jgi:hypothetical protein
MVAGGEDDARGGVGAVKRESHRAFAASAPVSRFHRHKPLIGSFRGNRGIIRELAIALPLVALLAGCAPKHSGDQDAYWRTAATSSLASLSPDDLQTWERAVLGVAPSGDASAAKNEAIDKVLAARGIFSFQDGHYHLISPVHSQSPPVIKIKTPKASKIFISENAKIFAFMSIDDPRYLNVFADSKWSKIKIDNGDFVAGVFVSGGEFLFAVKLRDGTYKIKKLSLGRVSDVANIGSSAESAFSCRITGGSGVLPLVTRTGNGARIAYISASGDVSQHVVDSGITSDCIVGRERRGLSLLWSGRGDDGVEAPISEGRISQARDAGSGRVLYRELGVMGVDAPVFLPTVWEAQEGRVLPKFFSYSATGPLNGGGNVEPFGATAYVLVAADAIISINNGKSCSLADGGIGIGGFYTRTENYVAAYDPFKGQTVITKMQECSVA